ncbi:MAG: hypothetical protein OXH96_24080 [Spirochaetaceae bacterium]|nr:hypothetical protein [Spirochaetaceae bacterium]
MEHPSHDSLIWIYYIAIIAALWGTMQAFPEIYARVMQEFGQAISPRRTWASSCAAPLPAPGCDHRATLNRAGDVGAGLPRSYALFPGACGRLVGAWSAAPRYPCAVIVQRVPDHFRQRTTFQRSGPLPSCQLCG